MGEVSERAMLSQGQHSKDHTRPGEDVVLGDTVLWTEEVFLDTKTRSVDMTFSQAVGAPIFARSLTHTHSATHTISLTHTRPRIQSPSLTLGHIHTRPSRALSGPWGVWRAPCVPPPPRLAPLAVQPPCTKAHSVLCPRSLMH